MRTRVSLRLMVACSLLLVLSVGSSDAVAQEENRRPRGWLGVFVGEVPESSAQEGPDYPGAFVQGIVVDSPADRAGLRASDIITRIDGRPVLSSGDLIARLGATEPGSALALTIERRGKEREVHLRLGERPPDSRRLEMRRGWIGAAAIDLPDPLRLYLGAPEASGVMISDLDEFGPAVDAGLELGDVLFEIEGRPVDSVRRLEAFVESGGVGNVIEVKVMRRDLEIALEVLVQEKPKEEARKQRRAK